MVISELLVYITCINQYKTSMPPSQVTSQAFTLLKIGLFQFLLPKTNIEFKCQFKYPNPFQARSNFPPPPPQVKMTVKCQWVALGGGGMVRQ